jgi:hypothetical protein
LPIEGSVVAETARIGKSAAWLIYWQPYAAYRSMTVSGASMDIVNYYLGDDSNPNPVSAERDSAHSSPTQPPVPAQADGSVMFGGALAYLGGGDSSGAAGQWPDGPVNGTVLDVTA